MAVLILAVSDTFIVARMTVLIVVGATFAAVAISERMRRKELVEQGIKDETLSLASELTKARESLDSIKRLTVMQEHELIEKNRIIETQAAEIARIKPTKPRAGMESI